MPIYQFQNAQGKIIEDYRSVDMRDICPPGFTRITVPQRIGFCTLPDPHTTTSKMQRGLRQMEDKYNRETMEKGCGFSKEKLKEVWEI